MKDNRVVSSSHFGDGDRAVHTARRDAATHGAKLDYFGASCMRRSLDLSAGRDLPDPRSAVIRGCAELRIVRIESDGGNRGTVLERKDLTTRLDVPNACGGVAP